MASGDRAAQLPSSSPPPPPPRTPPPPPPPPSPAPTENQNNHTAISLPLLQPAEARLTRWLRRLEAFLSAVGLAVSSRVGVAAAGSALAVVGVALPAAAVALSPCRGRPRQCDEFEVEAFEVCVLLSEAAAAAVSLGCVSRKMAMYGIRKFLFVDPELGMRIRFQKEYVARIKDFFRTLSWWIVPCFVVKVARELFRFSHLFQESIWRACVVLFVSVMSWMYLTTIVLASCMLFNLVCNLQVIHFDDFGKLLEQDTDPLVYLKEHLQLRHNLSKISHRFRMLLLLLFFSVTASQFAILFKTTAYNGSINFTNGGDIAVSSVVQVVGLILCLHAAAKISHRAQNIAALASRWHALATCSHDSTYATTPNSSGNLVPFPAHLFMRDFSESDLESLESASTHGNSHGTAQLVSYMSSYHKRESLVLYLLSNPGGITIYGWIVDRTFLNTILMLELTLVLFVLRFAYDSWAAWSRGSKIGSPKRETYGHHATRDIRSDCSRGRLGDCAVYSFGLDERARDCGVYSFGRLKPAFCV